nr:hypothetical protein [Tanacetum cinerariifolium]
SFVILQGMKNVQGTMIVRLKISPIKRNDPS